MRHFRPLVCACASLLAALTLGGLPSTAMAQSKEVITFAAVTFSEAGRGDRLKAWVDKGGELIALPAADKAEIMAKLAPVGEDIGETAGLRARAPEDMGDTMPFQGVDDQVGPGPGGDCARKRHVRPLERRGLPL